MADKHKTLYLFLALACFLGIILIFVFDGYMGVYDSIVMDNGQFQQKVEADRWDAEKFGYLASTGVERGGRIDFTYTVENHRFSKYTANVGVSLWYGDEKLLDLTTAEISAGAFSSGELTWTLETANLVPEDYPEDQNYNLDMIIMRDRVERRVNININPASILKPIPVPPR
jgi:hypothetical protein